MVFRIAFDLLVHFNTYTGFPVLTTINQSDEFAPITPTSFKWRLKQSWQAA